MITSLLLLIIVIPSVILILNFMDVPIEVYLVYVLWIAAVIIFLGSLKGKVNTIFSPIT